MLSRRALGVSAIGLSLGGFPVSAATGDRQHAAMLRRSPEAATGVGLGTAAEVGLRTCRDDRCRAARAVDYVAVAPARMQDVDDLVLKAGRVPPTALGGAVTQ